MIVIWLKTVSHDPLSHYDLINQPVGFLHFVINRVFFLEKTII
jgi:hypothetical protein